MHLPKQTKPSKSWPVNAAPVLLMLALLISACSTPRLVLPPKPVNPVQLPALAPEPETSPICLPSCLENWQAEQQRLLKRLTPSEKTLNTAAPDTTKPEKK